MIDEEIAIPKLTDWENEPELTSLKNDLDKAKPYHDSQVKKINHWTDLLKIEGEAKPTKIKGRSQVQPKLIRRQAEWRYSALTEPFLSSYRLFKVEPRTFEDDAAAKQNELLLNYQFDTKLNKQKFIDDFVRTTVDEGSCIIKTAWTRVTRPVLKQEPVYDYYPLGPMDQQAGDMLQQAQALKQSDPRGYELNIAPELKAAVDFSEENGTPVIAQPMGMRVVQDEEIVENCPVVQILNPSNVYIDPSCEGDLNKAQFIVVAFETCRADLIKENRYVNLDKVQWDTSTLSDDYHKTNTPEDFNFDDAARKKVVAYEYWGFYDIHGNDTLVPIVATWIGNVLIRMEENPFPDEKLPFVMSTYLPIKRELYGEPDAELLEDNQAILGAVTRGMIDTLARSANSQQGFAKGFLDPLNKRRFQNGEDYEFNPSIQPQVGFVEHTYPELPQSAMLMLQLQNQEAESLTGVKAFSGGIAGDAYSQQSSYTSSAAVRGVLDASSKREMGILRRLAKAMAQIGEKIIAMNAVFLSEKEVIRVTNRQFVEIRREDLKGNFDLQVDISTAEVDNAKAQDMGFMLQTLGPQMDPSIYMMILAEIADLKRMPVLAQRLREWRPQPDPVEEQMKQMQLQLAQAQVQLLQAQAQREMAVAQKAGSDAQVNMFKAGTEQAKAENETVKTQIEQAKAENEILKSQYEVQQIQSDMAYNQALANKANAEVQRINLETYEEAHGINHQRNLELQQSQARGNQNLEVLKGIMKSRKPDETKPDVEAGIGFNVLTDRSNEARMNNRYSW